MIFFVALVLLTAVLAVAGRAPSDSLAHAVDNDGANGTSALRQLAERMGHPTGLVEGRYELPSSGLLFMFTPTTPFTDSEAGDVRRWVEAGGILVYGSEAATQPLEETLGLRRGPRAAGTRADAPGDALPGVRRVEGTYGIPFEPAPAQERVLADGPRAVGLRYRLGRGEVVALSIPAALGNGQLLKADNAPLAGDLISLAAGGARVSFDEFHHGAQDVGSAAAALYSFSWGRALVLAVAVLFLGVALRGRVVGPPIPLAPGGGRSAEEHTQAVGRLLQRSGARRETLEALVLATRRAVARRQGLVVDPRRPDFHELLGRRDQEAAAALRRAEAAAAAVVGESGLGAAGRALHDLAYPERPPQRHGGDPN